MTPSTGPESADSPRTPRVSIRAVAEHAGVSKSLVSLVLRGAPNVSDQRRRAVERSLDELGYRADSRTVSTTRSSTVGVLVDDLRNPWFVDLLEGLTVTLDGAGRDLVIADAHLDRRIGRDSVNVLMRVGIDGLIVVGDSQDPAHISAAASRIPVVLAGGSATDLPGVDEVINDDRTGSRLMTEHLIELGHSRIAHLQGPGRVGADRRLGYEDAMSAAGLSAQIRVEPGASTELSGAAAAGRLLDAPANRPSALQCFNDVCAIGALGAAADRGLRVPDDLSVTGYDNSYLASIRHLSLSSVDTGTFAIGATAGRSLLARLDGTAHREAQVHTTAPSLVIRSTTARPAAL
ncbi:MAG: LacI family DNA-binding transcriptional regulator [Mycetocola sp.]